MKIMWSYYLLFVIITYQCCSCSEFILDTEDCLLSSKNHSLIIDLKSAYSEENSVLKNYSVHFSLCPKMLKKCPKGSFICLADKDGKLIDIGSEIVGITFEGLYNIAFRSPNGSGNVYIMCNPDHGVVAPFFERVSQPKNSSLFFTYLIKWISSSSCPLRHFRTKNSCILYTKEQSFDLRPLQYSPDLHTTHESVTYILNFCKDVYYKGCSKTSLCAIRNGSPHEIATKEDSTLQHIESRGLTLTYRNVKGGTSVISFTCSLKSIKPSVQFVGMDEEDLFFNVTTSLICPPIKTNCLLQQNATTYDLSSLNLLKDNWHLRLNDGRQVIFNICGPLNYVPNILCSGGPYFACLFDISNNTLGIAYESKEMLLKPGFVSIEIIGSTVEDKFFKINITLECSNHNTYPILVNTGNITQNYSINWKIDAACPSEIHKGHDCKLKNIYTGYSVDVSPLHKINGDYVVLSGDESFRINICGHLNQSCSKASYASVCLKNKQGKELAIGQVGSQEPTFKDGQFLFNLEGEPCNGNVTKSKIKIILSCEYFEGSKKPESPEYIQRANECEFYFFWRTNLTCTEKKSIPCSLQSDNKIFDLSPLKNSKENYIIPHNASAEIVLNVCHSVIPGHRIRCHSFAGACLVSDDVQYILSSDYHTKKMQENLGLVSELSKLEYANGSLSLTYSSGGICELGSESTQKTVIIFECDEKANENDTIPVLMNTDKCQYRFKWKTQFACPIVSTCTLETWTNKYDFSSLMRQDWHVTNKNIILGVCNPVRASGCPSSSGACLESEADGRMENIGDFNSDFKHENNSIFLYYKTSKSKHTKIEFVCSRVELPPRYIKEKKIKEGVLTVISWPTSLVCDNDVKKNCCHQIENLCNEFGHTYTVPVDKNRLVFLSLCPTGSNEVNNCPASAASCIAPGANSTLVDRKSLGMISKQPTIQKDKSVIVEYFNGSVCKDEIKYSTQIRFHCSYNKTKHQPEFMRIVDDCRYEFDWGTHLLCNDLISCKKPFLNNISTVALEFLATDTYFKGDYGLYILNLCKPSVHCGSYICKYFPNNTCLAFAGDMYKTESHNTGITYFFSPSNNKTENGKCGAQVKFLCDNHEEGLSDPVIEEESDCFVRIVLKGNATCLLPRAKPVDNKTVAAAWYITPIVLAILVLVIVIAILLMKKRREGIIQSVQHVLRYRKLNNSSTLSYNSSEEEGSAVEFELHQNKVK